MHAEQVLLLIIIWCLCTTTVLANRQLGILRSVWHGLKVFWKWPRLQRVTFAVFSLPLAGIFVFGIFMLVLVTVNVMDRNRPIVTSPSYGHVAYQAEAAAPRSELEEQQRMLVQQIIDSVQQAEPIDYGWVLPPFELRQLSIPGTGETARLLHGRLYCKCREEQDSTNRAHLRSGEFQLVIFQLFPTTQSYHIVTDTVMQWVDYDKPLKPKTAI